MRGLLRKLILSGGVAAMFAATACSGGDGSPMSPSQSGSATGVTTIMGTAQLASAAPSASQLASHAGTTIRLCVSGTATCTDADDSGDFELTGDFSGDVPLEVAGPQGNVTLTVPDVRLGETVEVTLRLNGSTGILSVESRHGGDDSADDDSADDDSADDDSADDDSADDDSADDDSADDDSADDDSADDDSADDDSADDDSADDDNRSGGTSRS